MKLKSIHVFARRGDSPPNGWLTFETDGGEHKLPMDPETINSICNAVSVRAGKKVDRDITDALYTSPATGEAS